MMPCGGAKLGTDHWFVFPRNRHQYQTRLRHDRDHSHRFLLG